MFLIDKPFVSDFLIDTIRDNNFKIIATPTAKKLINEDSLNWISEEAAVAILKNEPQTPLYSNSENALIWIDRHLGESDLAKQIKILKDKGRFRELIKNLFPDFYFKKLKLAELHDLLPLDISFPFVIKPSIGFFSIGVHIVKNKKDWLQAKSELNQENLKSIFPESVLDTTNFIIEEFIHGEEFAIDYYYDEHGKVVILNVLHHLFSSGTDTSDRVYSTSKEIIESHQSTIELMLSKIGKQLNLKSFPAHAEIRIDEEGRIVPIEINPLRFGGWCTTGDLLGVALGLNSYKCFIENKRPDWNKLFKDRVDKKWSIVVLDNNSGIAPANISNFNYSALANDFENPILVRELDINKYPVFGFVFTETSATNQKELNDILISDLTKYIT